VIDNSILTDLPSVLLAKGSYDKSISIITGHTAQDALVFTDPFITTSEEYVSYLKAFFPGISNPTLSFINTTLYPADYSGAQGYTSQFGRTNATLGEANILCNTLFLQNAYKGKSWGYNYVAPPALHADDLYPTFYPRQPPSPFGNPVNPALANTMQTYFTTFAQTGNPNTPTQPAWPLAGNNVVLNLGDTVVTAGDTVPPGRCAWWQKALFR